MLSELCKGSVYECISINFSKFHTKKRPLEALSTDEQTWQFLTCYNEVGVGGVQILST